MRQYKFDGPVYLKVMLYGEPGSTKTRTAATAALDERTSPCLMLESSGNPISIMDYPLKPDILTMETLSDYNDPYEWLFNGQNPAAPFCKANDLHPPYKTVIIDGLTETQRMAFKIAMGVAKQSPGVIPATPEIQHFNKVLSQMVTFARLYFSLPMHVIITSLERVDRDDQTGAIMCKPLLWGQSASEVAAYAYIVARLVHRSRLDNKTRMEVDKLVIGEDASVATSVPLALFSPTGKYVAKDQTGKLGSFMIAPSIAKMLDLITAERTKNESTQP